MNIQARNPYANPQWKRPVPAFVTKTATALTILAMGSAFAFVLVQQLSK